MFLSIIGGGLQNTNQKELGKVDMETLLYGFTATEQMGPHCNCNDQHCLVKGGRGKGACVTATLAKYLAWLNSIASSQNSDWDLLDTAKISRMWNDSI